MRVISVGPTKITKAVIDAVWRRRSTGSRQIIRDKDCRGLSLVVNATSMRWEYAYRPRGFNPVTGHRWGNRTVSLGTPKSLSHEMARAAAGRIKGEVLAGGDPRAERLADAAARRSAEALETARAAEAAFTFANLVDSWAKDRKGDRRPSYLREAVACLKRNLAGWLNRPVSEITVREAVRALDDIKESKGTVTANRTQAYARAAYSWATKRQMLTVNPLRGIERPGRESARERFLIVEELGAIWRACEGLGATRAAFVRTLMLTLQRREEVVSMRWGELDNPSDPSIWTLPGERAKNGKAHVIHLADPVRVMLRALPRVENSTFVFAGRAASRPIGGFSAIKVAIEKAINEAGAPSLADWRFHDFRRAGVTALAGMGFPPHVCDRLLNHITGAVQGIAAVYQRAEFLTERKAALDAWAKSVLAAAEGRTLMPTCCQWWHAPAELYRHRQR
jgi:integrase